jgi:hypothetical protein
LSRLSWPVSGGRSVELNDEPFSAFEASPLGRTYERVLDLEDPDVTISRYGLVVKDANGGERSLLITGAGGCTAVNERSLVALGERCFIAIGVYLLALELETLELDWRQQVDRAACCGVRLTPTADALIAHGEMELARVSLAGDVAWRASGDDLFTGPLELTASAVLVDDSCGDRYAFDLLTGIRLAR